MTAPSVREALEFYANPDNWTDTPSWDGDPDNTTPKAIPILRTEEGHPCDCGDTARKALAAPDAPTAGAWRYEIKYGPEGEANYAWVYDDKNDMVCTTQAHHARAIVERMNTRATPLAPTPSAARERIARIIDPAGWRTYDWWVSENPVGVPKDDESRRRHLKPSLARSDEILAILALLPDAAATDDPLDDLVQRFSAALLEKLKAAREKYGFRGELWRETDWEKDCQQSLLSHLAKGDPRDVAAYCAFLWHHGWSTVAPDPLRITRTQTLVRTRPDAAAIRADEREKCATIAHDFFLEQPAKNDHVLARMQAGFEIASAISGGDFKPQARSPLKPDEVEWVVNDIAELGIKIGEQFFFLYKGRSLVYGTDELSSANGVALNEDTDPPTQHMWRPVFKREFGECAHPINYTDPTKTGTVSLDDSDDWKPLPAAIRAAGENAK